MNTTNQSPRLAVIVPVYKVEPYLRQCIESIQRQTFTDLRIILVDDGSPDSCGAICEEYAAEDSRILVLHKENGGQSSARNLGLQYIGDCPYVTYLDSDDWLELDLYRQCIEAFDRDPELDIVGYGYNQVYTDRVEVVVPPAEATYIGHEVVRRYAQAERTYIEPIVWGRIYRRELLEGIRFRDGYKWEDVSYCMEVFWKSQKYLFLPIIGLNYRMKRPGATTEFMDTSDVSELFDNMEELIARRQEEKEFVGYANTLLVNYIWTFWTLLIENPEVYRAITPKYVPFLRRARSRPYYDLCTRKGSYRKHLAFLYFPTSYMGLRAWNRRRRYAKMKKMNMTEN